VGEEAEGGEMNDWEMLEKNWEPGVDVRISEFGQFELQTNTPNGHMVTSITMHPYLGYLLFEWLRARDWKAIRANAVAIDASVAALWPEVEESGGDPRRDIPSGAARGSEIKE
jgi:hypothetical protein